MEPRGQPGRVAGEDVEFLPERCLWWPRAGVLACADLHWGKAETFQAHGVALPSGVLRDDLARLSRALERTGARRLFLLGDLVHAREGLTKEVLAEAARWRARHIDVEVTLIRGNHDRALREVPSGWHMREVAEALDEGPFRFAHHPEPHEHLYVWAGHVHPTVVLSSGAERLRLLCFHVGARVGVLPAFSAFTGGQNVRRRAGDRVYAVVEDSSVVAL